MKIPRKIPEEAKPSGITLADKACETLPICRLKSEGFLWQEGRSWKSCPEASIRHLALNPVRSTCGGLLAVLAI